MNMSLQRKLFLVGYCLILLTLISNIRPSSYKSISLSGKDREKKVYIIFTLDTERNYNPTTGHERKFDETGEAISALVKIYQKEGIPFVLFVTNEVAEEFGFSKRFDFLSINCQPSTLNGFVMIDPLGYLDFLKLMSASKFILTDSGGMQEETTVLGIPCITLRENTERPITVEEGTNVVVGSDKEKIVDESLKIINGNRDKKEGGIPKFWDGKAAQRIVKILGKKI